MRWIIPLLVSLPLLTACGALSSLSKASEDLDAYTLTPATSAQPPAGGRRHLIVELPTSAGALATDRILIKPLPYQAQYLPDGRWSEPAPELLQTLFVASFQNLGGFALVGRTANGLIPDHTLMIEIQSFQVEPLAAQPGAFAVKIGLVLTLIRESDRRIVATRRFAASEAIGSDDTQALVAAFDRALQTVLGDAVRWTAAQAN
jgi:cholesterol transport system auxiliary component